MRALGEARWGWVPCTLGAAASRYTLLILAVNLATRPDITQAAEGAPFPTVTIETGKLTALFRDNAESPQVLSGVDALFHGDASNFDAFDPTTKGASAGLNFEHIIAGHASPHNMFAPRLGKYQLFWVPGRKSVQLIRRAEDDPWKVDSTMTYTLVEPCYIDVDFRCTPRDATLFAPRGYAVFFFADYMNIVSDVALHFRGVDAEDSASIGSRPKRRQGMPITTAAVRIVIATPRPGIRRGAQRQAQPVELRRPAFHKAVLLRADHEEHGFHARCSIELHAAEDEIRFSLFKFKITELARPAWDWQYVIHQVEAGREYGFRARLRGSNSAARTIAWTNTSVGRKS